MDSPFLRTFFIFSLVLGAAGCPSDGPGDDLEEGETYISLTVSGGTLDAPVHFEGKSEVPSLYVFDDVSILSTGLNMPGEPPSFTFSQFTFEGPAELGTFDGTRFHTDMVVNGFRNAEGETVTYSLREHDSGSLTVREVSEARLAMDFSFDASPTQLGGKELVFHVEGTIEMRD